jgi:hypothetical protein
MIDVHWNLTLENFDRIWEFMSSSLAKPFLMEYVIMVAWEISNIRLSSLIMVLPVFRLECANLDHRDTSTS